MFRRGESLFAPTFNMAKNKFYTVWVGRQIGVFDSWDECRLQVEGFQGVEFDCCSNHESCFDYYKRKFAENGYNLPEIVFWNVDARNVHMPVTMNEQGVKLVSGASPAIFADVVSDTLKVTTPYDLMLKILAPYAEFDRVIA